MASVGGFRQLAAIGSMSVASSGLCAFRSPVKAEERSWKNPTYVPPARFQNTFAKVPSAASDDARRLAWSVRNLEVEETKQILEKWPQGATLIDKDDNTLFHLAASQPERYSAQPEAAKQLFELLFQNGWQVVDQKNKNGERAEVVARNLDPDAMPAKLLRARSHDFKEKLRTEKPLKLVGELSAIPWAWEYPVQDEQRRSFAGVTYKAVDPAMCSRLFQECVQKAPFDYQPDGRGVAWFVSEDCYDCPYRYSGHEHPGHVFPPFMEEIRDEVCGRICGLSRENYPNCCNVNIYPAGQPPTNEVGWHADDEVYFQSLSDDTRIISFSLGAAREFTWRLQGTDIPLGEVSLGDGDVMTMEGLFQKHYKHAVPRTTKPCGARLNFTFRWIVVKAHAEDAATAATTGLSSAMSISRTMTRIIH